MLWSRRFPRVGVALVFAGWPVVGAAAPAEVPVQRPGNVVSAQPAGLAPQVTSAAEVPGPPADAGVDPTVGATSPAASDPPAAAATQPPTSAPVGSPGLAEQLLGPSVNQHPERRPTAPVPTESEAAAAEDAAMTALYRDLYRPRNNPGRLHIIARAQYSLGSSFDGTLSGRTGGAAVDVGQSFNFIGYALTLRAEGGSIDFGPNALMQITGLLGGGPTLGLGRLGMMRNGYLDFRVGYDVLFAPARQRALDYTYSRVPAYVPHGPRANLNMGLLISPRGKPRMFHGLGLSIGYQVLVGSFRGDLPPSQFLSIGIQYWGS